MQPKSLVRCADCNQILVDKFNTGIYFHVGAGCAGLCEDYSKRKRHAEEVARRLLGVKDEA